MQASIPRQAQSFLSPTEQDPRPPERILQRIPIRSFDDTFPIAKPVSVRNKPMLVFTERLIPNTLSISHSAIFPVKQTEATAKNVGKVSEKSLSPSKTTAGILTPSKRYPAMRSPNSGRIRFDFTPGIRKLLAAKKRYIYSIKNHVKQRRYVGISGQCRGRLSHHAWSFNHPEKAKTPLSRDAHEHPDHFSVGLVRALSENDDGQAAETAVIVGTDSLENGYNTRLGGGGGVCQPVSSQETTAFTIDHVVAKIRENFHPSKKRLLKIRADRLISPFTKNEATMKNAVYEFLFDPTGDKKDRIHHIGYTTTTLGKRMSAHFSCINNKESKGGRSISLYREIRAHPEQVKVRTFDIKSLTSEGIPLPMLERAFMKFFVERGEQVRNIKGGGKGSVSKAQ